MLIDADLRKPLIAEYTHLADSMGLSEVLVGVTTLKEAVQPLGGSGVDVLVGGSLPPNPGELVASHQMAEVLREAKSTYDVIVVDSAPILAVADAVSLVDEADGMVIVTRAGTTTKSDLRLSLANIRSVGGKVYGVVISGVTPRSERALRDYQYTHRTVPAGLAEDDDSSQDVTSTVAEDLAESAEVLDSAESSSAMGAELTRPDA